MFQCLLLYLDLVKKFRTLLKNKDVNDLLNILNIFVIFEEPGILILWE